MPKRTTKRQLEKNERTRQSILESALKVVGRVGYSRASIAKIAEGAGISAGTFYLHFESKNDLYDQLLPWCQIDLKEFVDDYLDGYRCYMDFEERSVRAFFNYLLVNPSFYRVLLEAEVFAPKAWNTYVRTREKDYMNVLETAWKANEFPDYELSELDEVCGLLIAMRRSLFVKYVGGRKNPKPIPETAIRTYLDFVCGALHASNMDEIIQIWRHRNAPAQKKAVGTFA